MSLEIIDIEVEVTESNSEEVKGELRNGCEVIAWYIPISNLCRTLGVSEDLEKIKELISTELKGTRRAKIDKRTVPHYVIKTNNFVFFLPKKEEQTKDGACVYPFIKSSYFEHKKDYRPDIKLEKFQELTIAATNAIKERLIERGWKERKYKIEGELNQILKLFGKKEVDSALKCYDTLLKASLVRGNLSIDEFKMLHTTSKTAEEMGDNIKAILWLIPYKMKKKVEDDVS